MLTGAKFKESGDSKGRMRPSMANEFGPGHSLGLADGVFVDVFLCRKTRGLFSGSNLSPQVLRANPVKAPNTPKTSIAGS